MRSCRIIQVGSKSNKKNPYKRQKGTPHKGEGSVKMEAETGMRQLQAATDGLGTEAFCARAFRGSVVLLTPSFWTSGLQNCERIPFVGLSLPVYDTLLQ